MPRPKPSAGSGRPPGRRGECPRRQIDAAVQAVKRRHWTLDIAARTATHLSDTPLAQLLLEVLHSGHAADAALASDGVNAVVVNGGGIW